MIILVNGASSSGKTSLARALQDLWEGPLIYNSLDQVISTLPFSYTGKGEHANLGFPIIGSEVLVGQHGYTLNKAFCEHILRLDASGFDVVVDYIMLDQQIFEAFEVLFRSCRVFFVGLDCDARELAKRNNDRPDRITGLSKAQQSKIHFCRNRYDITLDSATIGPEELASLLFAAIKSSNA